MNQICNVCCRFGAIAILVAAALWIAEHPDTALHYLPASANQEGADDRIASVRCISWTPAGDRMLMHAPATENPLTVHDLVGAQGGRPIDVRGDQISSLSSARDGRHALVSTYNGRLWWIDLETDEASTLIPLPAPAVISSSAISHDQRLAAVADCQGRVFLCKVPTESTSAATDSEPVACGLDWPGSNSLMLAQDLGTSSSVLRFSPSDDLLLWGGNDGSLRIWDLKTATLLQTFRGCRNLISGAEFLPGNDRILSASLDDTVRIWDVASGRELWRGQFSCNGVTALALSADGKTAAWAGHSRKIYGWDVEQEKIAFEIPITAPVIWNLKFSPDGRSLAAAGDERVVRFYDARTGARQREVEASLL